MTAYPTTLSTDDWQIVVGLMTGQKPTAPHAVHAGWDAIGFCLGQALPDNTVPTPSAPMNRATATKHVQALAAMQPMNLSPAQWLALAGEILQILQSILGTPAA